MVVLRGLVGRRGGLEAIELDGLAEILSLYDILPFPSALLSSPRKDRIFIDPLINTKILIFITDRTS